MEKEDARYQKLEQLHERRKQVVRLHRKGYGVMAIAELTGLSYPAARLAIDLYEEGAAAALKPHPRARTPGDGRRLNADQEEAIRRTICDKRPEQLKMIYALWSRQAVAELILNRYGIKLAVRTMGLYLERWGFTPQKPMKKAYEQSPAAVKKWLDEDYPVIAACAKAEGAEIHWGDETGVRRDDVRGRSYATQGQTPVIRVNNKRHGLSVISTVTNKGQMRWQAFDGALSADILIDFLRRLVKDAGRKIYLILDNRHVHHSKPVKAWLAEHKHEIEVFYLPSYSPELSPNEMANADLKQVGTKLAPARSKLQLVNATRQHLLSV
ncbi:MAG: IS630 family transposase [Candidatus Protistobacter heckmanni]|nr:IS630 family transposase [Candidatus Protistobacter heckmanni]